jgi:hypothetical protein
LSPSNQQWFRVDIPLVDEWFRVTKLPSDAIVLFLHIMRKMVAWDKTTDTISVSQLMAASGMKETRVHSALKALEKSGCPLRKIGHGRVGSTYSFDPSWGSESRTPGVRNPAPTTDVKPVKYIREIEQQEPSLARSDVLFKNQETGRVWKTGQEVSCLTYEQKITTKQAEAIIKDGNGMSVATILAILKKSRENIDRSENRIGYMRGIIQNLAPGKKANHQPEATSKPHPRSAAPLPLIVGRRSVVEDEDDMPF